MIRCVIIVVLGTLCVYQWSLMAQPQVTTPIEQRMQCVGDNCQYKKGAEHAA